MVNVDIETDAIDKDMTMFNIEIKADNKLKIGFGNKAAQNNEIVK